MARNLPINRWDEGNLDPGPSNSKTVSFPLLQTLSKKPWPANNHHTIY